MIVPCNCSLILLIEGSLFLMQSSIVNIIWSDCNLIVLLINYNRNNICLFFTIFVRLKKKINQTALIDKFK